ncbi:MAG: 4-hydroxythreonine-4-phosphate dehydrogenase PdxA [Flavobacteriaceae bacterium]|jgi:4-hydroxythreonine-4-phosphate dehydrogenase|nr:4-hydroxythreonine-4-phosphate dehydrogenase PdxA [Flavobacteriaceae bacterium]|tara:strand:- start:9577 stop:10545 length:969 start_codon:yes stop_codon:yes gene_type:complete
MKKIALSPGDPAGIGPEVCLKSLFKNRSEISQYELIGDIGFYESLSKKLNLNLTFSESSEQEGSILVKHIPLVSEVDFGNPVISNSKYILDVLMIGALGCLSKEYSGLVTGPINKKIINEYGFEFSGHTEFLADISNSKNVVMLLANKKIRVALLTTHIPLKKVSESITIEKIIKISQIADESLRRLWKIKDPKICVLGLNPHAGEGGFMGSEEVEVIKPAIEKLKDKGLNVQGPISADTAFIEEKLNYFDLYIAMFHDQGLPVLKSMGFGDSINITLGLPFVRVSVDHGTAYEIAGKGLADFSSFDEAMRLTNFFSNERNG